MRFQSKIDPWLAVVLVGASIATAVSTGVVLTQEPETGWRLAVSLLLMATGTVIPLWLLAATYYLVQDGELRVHCGPFRWRVPLASITSVTPTRSPLSSPALSLDRLRIEYGSGRVVMVSPRDREGFLRAVDPASRRVT